MPSHCIPSFFFDGLAVGKFEIGFASQRPINNPVPACALKSAISSILALPVRIPSPTAGHIHGTLGTAGTLLANAYLHATTRVKHQGQPRSTLVRSGAPLLLLECSLREQIDLPYDAVHVPIQPGVTLRNCLVPNGDQSVHLWFLDQSIRTEWDSNFTESARHSARRLRLYLLRLHAEHECLRLALRSLITKTIQIPPRSNLSDAFQHYLNEATRRIGGLQRKAAQHLDDKIHQLAINATSAARPGEIMALRQVLERLDLRPNVRRKIHRYADEWSNVTIIEHMEQNYMGDVIRDIQNSIIATRSSIAEGVVSVRTQQKNDVADSIKSLDELIVSVAESELPADKKQECLELLKGLTDELKRPKPSKIVMSTIGESLLSALSAVASISTSVKACFEILKPLWK